MDFIELARSRYSCKSFDSRQISKEQLDCILEAGRLASTANHNSCKPIEEIVTYL